MLAPPPMAPLVPVKRELVDADTKRRAIQFAQKLHSSREVIDLGTPSPMRPRQASSSSAQRAHPMDNSQEDF